MSYLKWPNPSQMRLILSLSLALISLSVVAQNPFSPDFPFPYNPDGNADGYIGLNDMLDLLSVYGQQYPESFYGDSTGAVLLLGYKTPGGCLRASTLAGKTWRIMNTLDARRYDIEIAQLAANQFGAGTSSEYFGYFVLDNDNEFINGDIYWTDSQQYWLNTQEGAEEYPDGFNSANRLMTSNQNATIDSRTRLCFLVTEVYPEIEYHIVVGDLGEVQSAVSDSISNGWILQGGVSGTYSDNYRQAIWKYAE